MKPVDVVIKEFYGVCKTIAPLKIVSVTWDFENLAIIGDNWTFKTSSGWRILNKEAMVYGSDDHEVVQVLEDLSNHAITEIKLQSSRFPIDPVILFDNNQKLECFSLNKIQSWSFFFPNGQVFIASPGLINLIHMENGK